MADTTTATRAILQSRIACPTCGHTAVETMATDSCRYFYTGAGCGARLTPTGGDCRVFCSHGDAPRPPMRAGSDACR